MIWYNFIISIIIICIYCFVLLPSISFAVYVPKVIIERITDLTENEDNKIIDIEVDTIKPPPIYTAETITDFKDLMYLSRKNEEEKDDQNSFFNTLQAHISKIKLCNQTTKKTKVLFCSYCKRKFEKLKSLKKHEKICDD